MIAAIVVVVEINPEYLLKYNIPRFFFANKTITHPFAETGWSKALISR